jgi:AcrR family transcriptional regulator
VDTQAGLRETLIVEALKILEAGSEEPTLRAVARAAGVSAMAPYRHFPDKTGLMAAVASRGFEMLRDDLVAADNRPDPGDALFAQGMALIEFARKNPALFRLMYSHQYGHASTDAVRGSYDVLAARVASIVPANAVVAVTLACRSLVQGMATIELNGRLTPAKPDDVATALRLFVRGLAAG